jgi:hypothetical protein
VTIGTALLPHSKGTFNQRMNRIDLHDAMFRALKSLPITASRRLKKHPYMSFEERWRLSEVEAGSEIYGEIKTLSLT